MTAQVAQDLRAAAEVLRRDGWTQGDWSDDRGCRCLEGAIKDATPTVGRWTNASNFLLERLAMSPIAWNDAPGRTADEVIAALEAAAAAAEREA